MTAVGINVEAQTRGQHLTMSRVTFAVLLVNVIAAVVAAPVEQVTVTAINADPIPVEKPHEPGVFMIGDIQIDLHRNAILNSNRWGNGQIPYVINSTFPSSTHDKIIAAMREIEHDVNNPTGAACIKFVPRTTQVNYVEVYPGSGCHSAVGDAGKGRQTVSIGSGCESKGIVMHELIHAVGFWHEQSRSDRDNYVKINLTNVLADDRFNFKLLTTANSNNLNVTYDFSSIMHYAPYDYAVDKSIPTITSKPGLGKGEEMGQRFALSKLDTLKIQKLYGCTEDTTHITTPLASSNVLADCNFESSLCNLHSDTTADFEWIRRSGASSAGPKIGHTNGADPYLIATASGHHGVARVVLPTSIKGPVCVDFYVYQPGLSSYLKVVIFGPNLPRQTISSYHNDVYTHWHHTRTSVNPSANAVYQVAFEANVSGQDDVAIDDLHIYHGQCQ